MQKTAYLDEKLWYDPQLESPKLKALYKGIDRFCSGSKAIETADELEQKVISLEGRFSFRKMLVEQGFSRQSATGHSDYFDSNIENPYIAVIYKSFIAGVEEDAFPDDIAGLFKGILEETKACRPDEETVKMIDGILADNNLSAALLKDIKTAYNLGKQYRKQSRYSKTEILSRDKLQKDVKGLKRMVRGILVGAAAVVIGLGSLVYYGITHASKEFEEVRARTYETLDGVDKFRDEASSELTTLRRKVDDFEYSRRYAQAGMEGLRAKLDEWGVNLDEFYEDVDNLMEMRNRMHSPQTAPSQNQTAPEDSHESPSPQTGRNPKPTKPPK